MGEHADVAARIGKMAAQRVQAQIGVVGSGSYALVSLFDDGSRLIAITGFDTAYDAEIYAGFLNGIDGIEQVAKISTEEAVISMLTGRPPVPAAGSKRVGFAIVVMTAALPSGALDWLKF